MRVSVVQCRGTPYEVGQQQGRIFVASKRGLSFQRSNVKAPAWVDTGSVQMGLPTNGQLKN
jgi:hypothetical protein